MSTTISCPVCNEILEAKAADTHVNTCLDKVGLQEKKSGNVFYSVFMFSYINVGNTYFFFFFHDLFIS